MSDPWRIALPFSRILKAVAPTLPIPPRGWNAAAFARHGVQLIGAIDRLAKLTQHKARPVVAKIALDIFNDQLEQVIALVVGRPGLRSVKDPVTIALPQNEALWARAIEAVFADRGGEISTRLMPPIQSVMGQAYSRVSVLLGQETSATVNQRIARQAREIAEKIRRIDETTKKLFRREIEQSIKDGQTVTETAQRLRDTIPQMERNRINTIARTETSNAWNKGSVAAYQDSATLTHCSVVGCESREEDRWGDPSYQPFLYRGESTCNIRMVPVTDIDKLVFHPNHTGVMVPAAFRNADGTVEPLE